jgi:putative membrane protein
VTLRIVLAALHLIALGLGVGAVRQRAMALREDPTVASLRRAFRADTQWGMAAALWISTGLWRLLAGTEKPTGYYLGNHFFMAKMGLLLLILSLELSPMITLIKWRRAIREGGAPEAVATPAGRKRIATISMIQGLLVVLMVFAAVMMARGLGVN